MGTLVKMEVVLLIDDDDDVRAVTAEGLRRAGFDVVAVSSGAEGYAAIGGSAPAAILLDYDMPLIDGRLTAEAFRLDPSLARIPIVGVSGHRDATSMRASPNVVTVLRKPFELDALIETVRRAVRPEGRDATGGPGTAAAGPDAGASACAQLEASGGGRSRI